jgi:hypothetical protein
MEERVMKETERIVLKGDTPLCLRLLQLVERLEVAIGDGLVGERPEALSLAATPVSRVGETRDGYHQE